MILSRVAPGRYQVAMEGKTLEGDWDFIAHTLAHDLHAEIIDKTIYALPNRLRKNFTATHMLELRALCKEMWAKAIRDRAAEIREGK